MPGIFSKVGKTWNCNPKPGKKMKFENSVIQDSHFKMSFTKKILFISLLYLHYQNKLIQRQIDLGFHCLYLEITWKLHGILCHSEVGSLNYDQA